MGADEEQMARIRETSERTERLLQQLHWRLQRDRAHAQRGAAGAVAAPAVAECVVVELMEYRTRRDASAAAGGA